MSLLRLGLRHPRRHGWYVALCFWNILARRMTPMIGAEEWRHDFWWGVNHWLWRRAFNCDDYGRSTGARSANGGEKP